MRVTTKRLVLIALVVACAATVAARPLATAQNDSTAVCILPDNVKWNRDSSVHGLETAALFGDPTAAEPYVQRIKFPPNHRLPPHSHPNGSRMVTVLSGTLYFAFGDKFDESKLKALPPGTFFVEPKDTAHYALTKGEVVLELHATGPAGTKYVEPTPKSPQR
jgi:quercetin dioxygenase-like cupin family protein